MITYEKPCSIVQQLDNLGEPVAQDTDHILKRKHPFEYQKGRPTYWYSPINKMMILPDGTKGTVPTNTPSLTHLLDYIAKRTIKEHQKQVANLYLVAGKVNKTRPRREWFDVIHANGLDEKLQWKQARRPFWKRLQYK